MHVRRLLLIEQIDADSLTRSKGRTKSQAALVTSVKDLELAAAGPEKSAPLPESDEGGEILLRTESEKNKDSAKWKYFYFSKRSSSVFLRLRTRL